MDDLQYWIEEATGFRDEIEEKIGEARTGLEDLALQVAEKTRGNIAAFIEEAFLEVSTDWYLDEIERALPCTQGIVDAFEDVYQQGQAEPDEPPLQPIYNYLQQMLHEIDGRRLDLRTNSNSDTAQVLAWEKAATLQLLANGEDAALPLHI